MPPQPTRNLPAAVANAAAALYKGVPGSLLQRLRPYICPFDELIEAVPHGARMLDVGCGSGLFLGLLAAQSQINFGVGFDANPGAIARAEQMRRQQLRPEMLRFEHLDAAAAWPVDTFDAVSIVDVMHHVPPIHQQSIIANANAALRPGGILLYKDMVERPLWRAWMNRLHDLVLVREWIHYVPLDTVSRWAHELGLVEVRRLRRNMLWYGHELILLEKPTK